MPAMGPVGSPVDGNGSLFPVARVFCIGHNDAGHAVGIDLTRRDFQAEAKKRGRPQDMVKGFDCSDPVGVLAQARCAGPVDDAEITFDVNGVRRHLGKVSLYITCSPC